MKTKGGPAKKSAAEPIKGCIQFVLLPNERKEPDKPWDMAGVYKGKIRILKGPPSEPFLSNGAVATLESYHNLISCSPYFVYSTNQMKRHPKGIV